MTPERWRRVRELFDRTADLGAEERDRFLERECGSDAGLGSEVRALLASSAVAGEFLETPAIEQMQRGPAIAEVPPVRIGPWQIERELGHGGMGTVYLGVRAEGEFRQSAAVKLVRRGMDTDFILRRFRTEREILAGLDHPYIARLLDGGSTTDGLPYFAMEYVEGRHLLEDCAARGADVRQRVELFLQVCEAVAYAHRHLVVHRDLKPSNILVTAEGAPKLLDFGLAKLLQPEAGAPRDRTETALRLLTPDYASPEQIRGERITTATDIYSLGVVLYELLTGRRPYGAVRASSDAIARAVCEQEPARPGLGSDLDNIILMALRKEPERRYPSVEALADDLRRQQEGRPVTARKDTLGYRVGRFVSRHRVGTVAAVLGALALAGALGAAISQARVARVERAEAERRFDDVRRLANSFLFEFHDAIKDLPGSTPARELVVRRALEYLEKLSSVRHGDDELQRELAEAYERVARVQGGLFESHLGDTEGARKSLLHAIAIREHLARAGTAADREALAETELQLAQVLMSAGDASGAAARARRAVTTLEKLSAAAPLDRRLEARRARAHRYVGAALVRSSARAEALTELTSAERAFDALASSDPGNKAFRRELAITNQLIVHALGGSRERERALHSYTKAVALQSELAAAEPGNSSYERELAYTHVSMGAFYEWSGDEKSALETYARALPILESLVATDPRNADTRLLLAETCNSVGYAQVVAGAVPAGLANLERSRALLEPIAAADPANVRATLALARLYESLGTARAGDRPRALGWYRRSVEAYGALRSRGALDPQAAAELEAVAAKIAASTGG